MNCLLCFEVQETRILSNPEGKEVHSGVIHTRGTCGASAVSQALSGEDGREVSQPSCAPIKEGPSPCPQPCRAFQAIHLPPGGEQSQDVPSFPLVMATEEPESSVIQAGRPGGRGQRQGLAA